jgi:hypothetical protein
MSRAVAVSHRSRALSPGTALPVLGRGTNVALDHGNRWVRIGLIALVPDVGLVRIGFLGLVAAGPGISLARVGRAGIVALASKRIPMECHEHDDRDRCQHHTGSYP